MLSHEQRLRAQGLATRTTSPPSRASVPPMPQKVVRVLIPNFYYKDDIPKAGDIITLDADMALAMVQQQRVEYVDEGVGS